MDSYYNLDTTTTTTNAISYNLIADISEYIIIDRSIYRKILTNIDYNYLLIIFTMSCVSSLICLYKKPKDRYTLIQEAKPHSLEYV